MIGAKRTGVFPLCVSNAIAFADRDPATLTCANPGTLIGLIKPWNNLGRLWPMPGRGLVVVRQRTIESILPRGELRRNITNTVTAIRIVESAVAVAPIFVPRTRAIWDGIVREIGRASCRERG